MNKKHDGSTDSRDKVPSGKSGLNLLSLEQNTC